MTHMQIACRLLDGFSWIIRPEDFVLGSIAPDAVHFCDSYQVGMKEASHLWNCGPQWGITTDSESWKENILRWWKKQEKGEGRDFAAGYCAHIWTDWLYDIYIWGPLHKAYMNDREDREEWYLRYRKEVHSLDQWLNQTSAETQAIWAMLGEARSHSIKGCIESKDVEKQRLSILTEQFPAHGAETVDIHSHTIITRDLMEQFINDSIIRIPMLFTG